MDLEEVCHMPAPKSGNGIPHLVLWNPWKLVARLRTFLVQLMAVMDSVDRV